MTNKILILFTLNYPFGVGEEFIENEIKEASNNFSKIIIIPNTKSNKIRSIPANAEVITWDKLKDDSKKYSFIEFLNLFYKELSLHKTERFARVKSIKVSWNYYKEQFDKAIAIKNLLKKLTNNIHSILLYDFWATNNALAITLAKESYPSINYIACTHNFDLYDFRWQCPIPFRGLSIQKIDKIFPDSKYGIEYLKLKLPKSLHNKIELAYMGTPDFGLSPIPKDNKITILSTSTCIPHKRVDWIIESISNLKDTEFQWIHFGDGPILEELKEKAEKLLPMESFEFKGWVDFDELIDFYKKTPIDIFVHMSTAEGLPVSLMIASSFGVPIVAVDSMGVKELINTTTGQLLPSNCTIGDATKAIENIIETKSKSKELRVKAKDFCMKNFSIENYKKFYTKKLNLKKTN